jgi:hypothetical protein
VNDLSDRGAKSDELDYVPSLYLEKLSLLHNESDHSASQMGMSYGEVSDSIPSLVDNTVTTAGDDDLDREESEEESEAVDKDEVPRVLEQHAEEGTLEKAINAVLQEHHHLLLQDHAHTSTSTTPHDSVCPSSDEVVVFPHAQERRESSLEVARRDSCSTISTAPETPESPLVISEFICVTSVTAEDGQLVTTTSTTTQNPATEPCTGTCRRVGAVNDDTRTPINGTGGTFACRRCATLGRGPYDATATTVWPLAFFFVCPIDPLFPADLSGIRKSKKFVPDPFTVGDFYGDDDEDIRFVPPSSGGGGGAAAAAAAAAAWWEHHEEEEIVFGPQEDEGEESDDDDDNDNDNYDYETITTYCREDYDEEGGESEGGLLSLLTAGDSVAYKDASQLAVGRSLSASSSFIHDDSFHLVHDHGTDADPLRPRHFSDHHRYFQPHSQNLPSPFSSASSNALTNKSGHPAGGTRKFVHTASHTAVDQHRTDNEERRSRADDSPGSQVPLVPRRMTSIGLEGVLPPSRHDISILVPHNKNDDNWVPRKTARRRKSSFTIARIEI